MTNCNETEVSKASWSLDNNNSSLSITSIKKSSVAEAFHFKSINGRITADGQATIAINLASIESHVDIRNERLKKILFEIALFPKATILSKLDLKKYYSLNVGYRLKKEIGFSLNLHGQKKPFSTEVFVTRLSKTRFAVSTTQPIMILAEDFKFTKALKKLAKLAKLPSIDTIIPVSFNLVFNQK